MSRASLRGVDLTRPTAELRAETGATKQAVWIARKRAGLPCECPAKSSLKIGRSRRPKAQRVEKLANAAPVAVPVVETSLPTWEPLCRPRSAEFWEREPGLRRTDR